MTLRSIELTPASLGWKGARQLASRVSSGQPSTAA
jgi:hypothetical protein